MSLLKELSEALEIIYDAQGMAAEYQSFLLAARRSKVLLLVLALLWCIPPLHALTSPSKTRAEGSDQSASGRFWTEDSESLEIAAGCTACGYETASGRPKWLNEDPIGENGGFNLYGFVGNNPLRYVDPYGQAWYDWQWIDTAANWGTGLGDHLSFGLTDWARDGYGLNDVVDKCSGTYGVGTATGVAFDLATTGGSLALSKSAGRATAKQLKNDRRVGRKVLDLVKGDGKEAHHVNPLKGHPPIKGERGGPPTIFPTGGLPSWLRNHPMNLQALDEAGHAAAHARVRGAEKVARAMGLADPYASAIRGGLSAGRLSGGCD